MAVKLSVAAESVERLCVRSACWKISRYRRAERKCIIHLMTEICFCCLFFRSKSTATAEANRMQNDDKSEPRIELEEEKPPDRSREKKKLIISSTFPVQTEREKSFCGARHNAFDRAQLTTATHSLGSEQRVAAFIFRISHDVGEALAVRASALFPIAIACHFNICLATIFLSVHYSYLDNCILFGEKEKRSSGGIATIESHLFDASIH